MVKIKISVTISIQCLHRYFFPKTLSPSFGVDLIAKDLEVIRRSRSGTHNLTQPYTSNHKMSPNPTPIQTLYFQSPYNNVGLTDLTDKFQKELQN